MQSLTTARETGMLTLCLAVVPATKIACSERHGSLYIWSNETRPTWVRAKLYPEEGWELTSHQPNVEMSSPLHAVNILHLDGNHLNSHPVSWIALNCSRYQCIKCCSLMKKQHCAALSVHLSNAFHTVDHILLSRLLSAGSDVSAFGWFRSFSSVQSRSLTN